MGWIFWLVRVFFCFFFGVGIFFPFLHRFCSYLSGAEFYPPEAAHSRCDKWDFHGCRGQVAGRFVFFIFWGFFESKGVCNGRKSISKDVVTPAVLPVLSGMPPAPPGDGRLGLPSRGRYGRSERTGPPRCRAPCPPAAGRAEGSWRGRVHYYPAAHPIASPCRSSQRGEASVRSSRCSPSCASSGEITAICPCL